MLTSGWAALEKCYMNNDTAATMMLAETMPDCHMDMDTKPQNNNNDAHCDNCNHCVPLISSQALMGHAFEYFSADYTEYLQNYAPPAFSFETPPPRGTYL